MADLETAARAALHHIEEEAHYLWPGRDANAKRATLVGLARALREALGLPEPVAPDGAPIRYGVEMRRGAGSSMTSFPTWEEARAWLIARAEHAGSAERFAIPAPVNTIEWQADGMTFRVTPHWTSGNAPALLTEIREAAHG